MPAPIKLNSATYVYKSSMGTFLLTGIAFGADRYGPGKIRQGHMCVIRKQPNHTVVSADGHVGYASLCITIGDEDHGKICCDLSILALIPL